MSLRERIVDESTPEPNTGCWLWDGHTTRRYGVMRVDNRPKRAHRVSFEAFNGPIPFGMCVCHRCDEPSCVRPDHLFLGTHTDNMRDMCKKGRHRGFHLNPQKGTQHCCAKITDDDVREIRIRVANRGRSGRWGKTSLRAIGADFGITHATVNQIAKGLIWRHIQ